MGYSHLARSAKAANPGRIRTLPGPGLETVRTAPERAAVSRDFRGGFGAARAQPSRKARSKYDVSGSSR